MFLCIGATPALQKVMVFDQLRLDQVNRSTQSSEFASGKSINVAKVLKSLGANVLATGFLGGDRGTEVERLLRIEDVQSRFVRVAPRTRQCITLLDSRNKTQTEIVEESSRVADQDYGELLKVVETTLPETKAMILSGTITPGGPADFYRDCIRLARGQNILTVVDAQGESLLRCLEAEPDVVKPNRQELAKTFNRNPDDEDWALQSIKELNRRGARRVVVTAGRETCLAFDGKDFWKIDQPVIEPVNPIGSGDAFTAALAYKLSTKAALSEACRWGSAAGISNAMHLEPGRIGTLSELEALTLKIRPIRIE